MPINIVPGSKFFEGEPSTSQARCEGVVCRDRAIQSPLPRTKTQLLTCACTHLCYRYPQLVWMSHGDEAVRLPDGFHCVAKSEQARPRPPREKSWLIH